MTDENEPHTNEEPHNHAHQIIAYVAMALSSGLVGGLIGFLLGWWARG